MPPRKKPIPAAGTADEAGVCSSLTQRIYYFYYIMRPHRSRLSLTLIARAHLSHIAHAHRSSQRAQVSRGIWLWKRLLYCNGFPITTIAMLSLEPQVCMQLSCLCYGFQHCAGAAQNNGGMASNKIVVSKDAGFTMLAKSLSDTLGYPIDKKQAQNKFSYLERKFHTAKTWHRSSGVGISADDRARGLSCAFLLHVKT